MRRRGNDFQGAVLTELALLFPILLLLFLGLVQVVIYMQSRTVVQYAAFAAARAFQVYGDRTLNDIGYPHVREPPYTTGDQTIAEAAAEKVIFESLLWEHKRVTYGSGGSATSGTFYLLDRMYEDGAESSYDGTGGTPSGSGVVMVNFIGCRGPGDCSSGSGAEVIYCLPILFPGINVLFGTVKSENPCTANDHGRKYDGIAIRYLVPLPREPVEM